MTVAGQITDERPSKPWPLGGYAPGNCMCQCATCGKRFEGDKLAVSCLECAASQANDALTELQHRREAEAGVKQIATEIEGLIDAYWNAAYAEGEQHRTTDTPDGRAQKIRSGITSRLARLAASPSAPASGVRVKALEWGERRPIERVNGAWDAKTTIGWYVAATASGEGCKGTHYWFIVGGTVSGWGNSEAEVKAAAQADYEARILSALGEHP